MRNFTEFVLEARRSTKKDEEVPVSDDAVVVNGKVDKNLDVDKLKGKSAKSNKSRGTFAVDEPTDDDLAEKIDMKAANKNIKRLENCIKTRTDFFIQGRAGWAKTSLIKKAAKRHGYTIVTVYLDKALASDLGGIPVPVKNDGVAEQEMAIPAWAAYMFKHPETKFLLFFDEMNQATPDVQNALMPIVLDHRICNIKYDNYFVGAAGNYQDENRACRDLSDPLMDRFRYIEWESNTDATWDDTFNYLRKSWTEKIGKKILDALNDSRGLFKNPRDIERYFLTWYTRLYEEGDNDWMEVEDVLDELEGIVIDQNDSSYGPKEYKDKLYALADICLEYLQKGVENEEKPDKGRGRRGAATINGDTIDMIKEYLEKGSIIADQDYPENGIKKNDTIGISLENFQNICGTVDADGNEVPLTAEQVEWLKNNIDSIGIKPAFKTNSEFKKKGYIAI